MKGWEEQENCHGGQEEIDFINQNGGFGGTDRLK